MKKYIVLFTFVISLLIPIQVLAVDFDITDATIDAQLHENGQVTVVETFTYSFDGKFKGITREIFPKKGSKIVNFSATENNQPLKIEKDEQEYRIHRKGRDEKITVVLSYVIESSMTKYTDMAEFYWPFFDQRNETDYQNMTITVHPPMSTKNVMAIGYDAANQTETIDESGSVTFSLGQVSSGENGDIRVAYPAEMFPNKELDENMTLAAKIEQEKEAKRQELALFTKNQERVKQISSFVLPIAAILLAIILFQIIMKKRERLVDVRKKLADHSSVVPPEIVSLTATIAKLSYRTSGLIGISLLDFIRRGNVKKVEGEDERFILVNTGHMLGYEENLVQWLFNRVGNGRQFQVTDINEYAKDKKNAADYNKYMTAWANGIHKETKDLPMYESKIGLRMLLLCIAIPLAVLSGFLINYQLSVMTIIFSILLTLGAVAIMIGYYPLTEEGLLHKIAWGQFSKEIDYLEQSDWDKMSEDDQARAYIFGIGMKESRMKEFAEQFESHTMAQRNDEATMPLVYTFMFISPSLHSNFRTADKQLSYSDSSSSSSGGFSGGGGVGGGGGGSGAF